MQKIEDVREIQGILLDILLHFQKVCQAHGLRYFLSNGTLLGAIKYQGFIPWDDDVDVFMPREDYLRLLELWDRDEKRYVLMAQKTDPNWRVPYAKLCDRNTVLQETSADFGAPIGLAIDIFPLDAWNGGQTKANLQALWCSLLRRGCSASMEQCFYTPRTGLKRGILYLIWRVSRLLGWKWFYNRIAGQVRKGAAMKDRPLYLGSVAWSLYGRREVIPAAVFDHTEMKQFEGHPFPVPGGYDLYLHSLYGDYHQDPPADRQRSHHSITVWRNDEQ